MKLFKRKKNKKILSFIAEPNITYRCGIDWDEKGNSIITITDHMGNIVFTERKNAKSQKETKKDT